MGHYRGRAVLKARKKRRKNLENWKASKALLMRVAIPAKPPHDPVVGIHKIILETRALINQAIPGVLS